MVCELKNIVKTYPVPGGSERLMVLDDVSFSFDKGESVAIVGPSGSGKSTFLQIAAGIIAPDSGKVFVDGVDIAKLGEERLSVMRNRKVGVMFQQHYLLPQCTLLENVLVPTLPYQSDRERLLLKQRALNILDRLRLTARLSYFPRDLSGGECQRAALARAIVNCPSLLCADEPTGSLDHASAHEMGDLLREINKEEQTALLLVTHSESLAARMDRTYILRDGILRNRE